MEERAWAANWPASWSRYAKAKVARGIAKIAAHKWTALWNQQWYEANLAFEAQLREQAKEASGEDSSLQPASSLILPKEEAGALRFTM